MISTTSAECNETYDPIACEFNMYCQNAFEIYQNWDYYSERNRYNIREDGSYCLTSTHKIRYNGNSIHPINLIYKHTRYYDFDTIPSSNEDQVIFDFIISLDLSNNNYVQYPVFRRMDNLATLNLSNNLMDTARLSNMNNLLNLKVIDLSHNNIRDIDKTDVENRQLFENLEDMNLSYNNLVEVPEAVCDLFSNIIVLDLSHNYIDTLSQISFEGVKKLIYLNLSYNSITDINASLFRFSELKTLDLSANKLSSVKANDFTAHKKLTVLNLKSNLIKSVDKESFHNLHNLRSLDISDNGLEVLAIDTFKNVDSLKEIIIAKNKLKKLPNALFKGKSIELFSVVENYLEGSIERGMFEGMQFVTELNLSNQRLDSIEDNAFYGLGQLVTLLLQNNKIKTLSPKCFNTLLNLKQLDLSNNKLENIEFEKERIGYLESLSIRNNYLSVVKHEHFQGLDSLQFLDLSDNKISWLESNSFKSLKNLISFEISNNPLNGTLEENTFEGLNSLPSLDISCSLLITIQNGSFNGMIRLKNLNISRSKIQTLQFNSFISTGAMETLDLSHNNIKEFIVNNSQISNLDTLYLNNNNIKTLDAKTFDRMLLLTKLILSYNEIENIDILTFANQKSLRVLDVSSNPNFLFNTILINNTNNMNELYLSGTKSGISFHEINNIPMSHIAISNASIENIITLNLNGLKHLDNLDLSYNKISKVDFGCFTKISTLKTLDLSYNQITYIQPGALKDNTELHSLNISHNDLTSITYGIFLGPIYLNTLDISYNKIDNLQNERFHELKSLSVLIADHNRIEAINAEEFLGTSLSILSIGDNPIPCHLLVNFQRSRAPFLITAINLVENDIENVNGITCNKNNYYEPHENPRVTLGNGNISSILINIRDILINRLSSHKNEIKISKDEEYLANITSQIAKTNYDNQIQLANLTKLASQIANKKDTNILLEKILKVLTMNSLKRPSTPPPITKNNATYDNLVNYINKLKEQLEDTIAFEKNNVLNEIDVKLSAVKDHIVTLEPVHEKLSAVSSVSTPIFTETCVALILLILVCLVLYKFYKSGLFMRRRLSISTRELPSAMDSVL